MDRLILLLIGICVFFSLTTYLLHRLFSGKKSVIVLLASALLLAAIYQFYLSRQPNQGFEDLAQLIMSMMFFTGFLSTAITGFILLRFYPRA